MSEHACPVEWCDHTGDLPSVRGHINGSTDPDHDWSELKDQIEGEDDQQEGTPSEGVESGDGAVLDDTGDDHPEEGTETSDEGGSEAPSESDEMATDDESEDPEESGTTTEGDIADPGGSGGTTADTSPLKAGNLYVSVVQSVTNAQIEKYGGPDAKELDDEHFEQYDLATHFNETMDYMGVGSEMEPHEALLLATVLSVGDGLVSETDVLDQQVNQLMDKAMNGDDSGVSA